MCGGEAVHWLPGGNRGEVVARIWERMQPAEVMNWLFWNILFSHWYLDGKTYDWKLTFGGDLLYTNWKIFFGVFILKLCHDLHLFNPSLKERNRRERIDSVSWQSSNYLHILVPHKCSLTYEITLLGLHCFLTFLSHHHHLFFFFHYIMVLSCIIQRNFLQSQKCLTLHRTVL